MKRPLLIACCAVLGFGPLACGPGEATPDPGVRTEDAEAVDLDNLRIHVSGRAEVFPEALALLQARGQPPPALEGLPVTIEEPLRVAVNDASATFGLGALAADGTFRIADVPVRDIHQGLSVGLSHEGLVRSTSIVYDTAFTGARPRTDLRDARAWVLPSAFVDALGAGVGESRLRGHTEGRAATLGDAGFLLGRVVDGNGQPVAGVRVVPGRSELAERVYYPSEDLTSAGQEGTGASGLFLYVHSGADAETFTLGVEGAEGYLARNAGASPGMGVVLTLYPGRFPPP